MSAKPDPNLEYYSRLRDRAVSYLEKWIGHFYLWAGDDPSGFDCSGLIVEVLQAVGLLFHKSDYSAHALYGIFKDRKRAQGYKGCLVFWPNNTQERIIHIEMLVDDFHTVGASGGGSRTKTIADAVRDNAFVKMRPITYRGLSYRICDPFAASKGG